MQIPGKKGIMAEKNIFRKEALEKLAMPEMLDKSLPVTKPLY